MTPIEVLLVEDNAGDVVLVRQALAGCTVPVKLHVARDGEQALTMLTNSDFKPGLIILDLNIPRIPGTTLLQTWHPGEVPVVVFSSSVNEAEWTRVLALGARDCVHKPTDFQAFEDAVCEIVEKWAAPQADGLC